MPERRDGTPCRTERRTDTWARSSLWCATPPATSQPFLEVLGSPPISRLSVASCVDLKLRSLPSTGVTRRRRYYGPLRHPKRSGLSLAGVRLRVTIPHPWGFPCCFGSPNPDMPSSLPQWDRWFRSLLGRPIPPISLFANDGGLPRVSGRSAPTLNLSRHARRSLALRPV